MHNTTCIVLLHKIGRKCKYPPPDKDVRPYYGISCFGNVIPQICDVLHIYTVVSIHTFESIHTLEQWTVKLYPVYDRIMQVSESSQK